MEVNTTTVRDLRRARGWTQQHLADACEISLRTVQRVEKDGTAAHDTVQGLCAVFDVLPDDLLQVSVDSRTEVPIQAPLRYQLMVAVAGLGGGIVGALVTFLVLKG